MKRILSIIMAFMLVAGVAEARRFGNMHVVGTLDVTDGLTWIAYGTSLPGTCTTGELFIDTDADTDGSLYICKDTDSWKEVDDDGASGGGDVTNVFDCTTGDCRQITVETGEYLRVDSGAEIEASETIIHVWNDTGSILYGCTAVYVSGFNIPNDLPTVAIADADDNAKMPALGLIKTDIANGASGKVIVHGHDETWDTTGLAVGDELYVNDSGTSANDTCSNTLTATRPSNVNDNIQKMVEVLRVHTTQGELAVSGAGRTNDVPNLQSAYLWVGNGSNVATAVQLSTDCTMDNAGAITCDHDALDNMTAAEHLDWANSVGTIHVDNYIENVVDTLAATLGAGADGNAVTQTNLGVLQGLDAQVYIDMTADGIVNIVSDTTINLSAGTITFDNNAGSSPILDFIDVDNHTLTFVKHDDGHAIMQNSEGAIHFKPSGDVTDYITMKTLNDISYIGRDDDDDLIKLESGTVTIAGTLVATAIDPDNLSDEDQGDVNIDGDVWKVEEVQSGAISEAADIDNDIITHEQIADADQTDTKCFKYLEADGIDDADDFPTVWRNGTANDFQLTAVWCETDANTVTGQLQIDDGSPVSIDGSDIVCDSDEQEDASLSGGDSLLAAGEELDWVTTSQTGSTQLTVCWTGNWVD